MRPQDYGNVKMIDAEIKAICDELSALPYGDAKRFELVEKRRELLEKRQKQIDFNIANETI